MTDTLLTKQIQYRIGMFCEKSNDHPHFASIGHAGIYAYVLHSYPDALNKRFVPNHKEHVINHGQKGYFLWTYSVYPGQIMINDPRDIKRLKRIVFLSVEEDREKNIPAQEGVFHDFDEHAVTIVSSEVFTREVIGQNNQEGQILQNLRRFGSYNLATHNCVAFATQEYTRITRLKFDFMMDAIVAQLCLPDRLHTDIRLLNQQIQYDGIDVAKAQRFTREYIVSDQFNQDYDMRDQATIDLDARFKAMEAQEKAKKQLPPNQ
jgi:hypothetical protein